jgi:hypothetical protein
MKECVMKNTIKLKAIQRIAGIIALVALIWSMTACGDDGGAGDDNTGSTLGQETLSIADQQVYTMEQSATNGSISYHNYTGGDLTLNDGFTPPLGTALISGGKLSYTQTAAPGGSVLEDVQDWLHDVATSSFSESIVEEILDWLDGATISPADTKCAVIDIFYTDNKNYYLDRINYSVSNVNVGAGTGTMTIENVMYMYVNKNVAITVPKFGPITIDPSEEYTLNAVNLSLTKGWNAVTIKVVSTETTSKTTSTISLIKGDTGRWILSD